MKKIKISIKNMWRLNLNCETFLPLILLKKHYEVEIVEQNADFVFCSMYNPVEYIKEKGIRIMCIGEQYTPNWNLVDYAIGYDYMTYEDRFIRMPNFDDLNSITIAKDKQNHITDNILESKSKFCMFMYSNSYDSTNRKEFFKKFNEYKFVEAAGKVCRNVDIKIPYDKKLDYQKEFKFTLAIENHSFPGYHTEKLIDAFSANTIPIYYGDPKVLDDINPKAFINANGKTIEEVLEEVKILDNDDAKYLNMLKQPVYNDINYIDNKIQELEDFLVNIIERGPSDIRRSISHAAKWEEKWIVKGYNNFHDKLIRKIKKKIKLILRKMKILWK